MSVRPRKKNALHISQNKAYQVILNPLVTEKSTQQSEYNKMVFSVPVNATKQEVKSSIEKKSKDTLFIKTYIIKDDEIIASSSSVWSNNY